MASVWLSGTNQHILRVWWVCGIAWRNLSFGFYLLWQCWSSSATNECFRQEDIRRLIRPTCCPDQLARVTGCDTEFSFSANSRTLRHFMFVLSMSCSLYWAFLDNYSLSIVQTCRLAGQCLDISRQLQSVHSPTIEHGKYSACL